MNGGRERRAGVCRIPHANQATSDCCRLSPGGGDVWPESGTVSVFCSDDGSGSHRCFCVAGSLFKCFAQFLKSVTVLPSAFLWPPQQ